MDKLKWEIDFDFEEIVGLAMSFNSLFVDTWFSYRSSQKMLCFVPEESYISGAGAVLVKPKRNYSPMVSEEEGTNTIKTNFEKNIELCIEILWAHGNGSTN